VVSARRLARAVAFVALAAAAWGAWHWLFPDDDALIRAALADAATRVSSATGESPVARIARLGGLRDVLTADVVLEGPGGLRLDGADRVVAAAAARVHGGATGRVRLVDLAVTRHPAGMGAEVHGIVELSGDGARDAREVAFAMQRGDDGLWRIARVTLLDPLERPAPAR
jgi:hypothetical protein